MTKSLKPFVLKDHSKLQTCLQSLQHHDDFMTHENKKQRNYFFSFIAVLVRKGVNFDEFFLDILGDSDTTNDSNDLVDTNGESNDHVDALDATSGNKLKLSRCMILLSLSFYFIYIDFFLFQKILLFQF